MRVRLGVAMGSEPKRDRYRQLLESGGKLFGDATGAGVGSLMGGVLGGPVGAVVGAASGSAITSVLGLVGREVSERLLSKREEARVGGVLLVAETEVQKVLGQGYSLRQDGFFEKGQFDRSDAEEVIENVLLKCQREPQEKKIRFMGYLLANLAFKNDIDVDLAHLIIKVADELTYRQLCLLSIASQAHELDLRDSDYRDQQLHLNDLSAILHECFDLYHRELINMGDKHTLGLTGVWPAKMGVQGLGVAILNSMQLWYIPDEDKRPIIGQLR